MGTRMRRGRTTPARPSSFFIAPTNHTYEEFAETFGLEVADGVFSSLYGAGKNDAIHRQLIPVKKLVEGDAAKYVFRLHDDRHIETVCIKRRTGITICLSTQVGCSVRCRFCKSGERGLLRSLNASEIVQQLLFVDERVNRIVFMGIGEPLHNYDEVIRAIHILRDRRGIDFPTDGITVSTVGPPERLRSLREEHLKIQLALSLHATDQATRDYLVPGMSRYGINEVLSGAMDYGRRHGRTVSISYLLLPGINDGPRDIERLGRWFSGKEVVVNLMRYNGAPSDEFKAASGKELDRVREALESRAVRATIRESMGTSIHAACGQLVAR